MRSIVVRREMLCMRVGKDDLHERILHFVKGLGLNPHTPIQNFGKYFSIISRGIKITDVLENLVSVKGYNNNAFMLKLLSNEATYSQSNVNSAGVMLIAMRLAKWSDKKIFAIYSELENEKMVSI